MPTLPSAFVENMKAMLGPEFDAFEKSLQQPAPVSLRRNISKNAPYDEYEAVPWCNSGRYLPDRPSFTLDPLFHAGTYYVQEPSSMFIEQALRQTADLDQPLRILDLCAAPGGKSTLITNLVSKDALVVSNEVIRARATVLSENIIKWGHPNCVVTHNDPRDFSDLHGFFDVVVIDAPCSGEGLFRKDNGAIAEWSPHNVSLCSQRQRRILSDVWPSLKKNGILIYCTCTYNHLENEENLKWLRSNHDVDFEPIKCEPSWGIAEVTDENLFAYRFFPQRLKGEGFFLSVVRKKEQTDALSKRERPLQTPNTNVTASVRDWLAVPDEFTLLQHRETVLAIPRACASEIGTLVANLHIAHAGTAIATVKHNKLVPEHALAMSIALRKDQFPSVELTRDEAIAYLRRESIHPEEGTRGFALVTYHHTPLGWINQLGTRSNNLYPTGWRIRMAG